MYKKILPCFVVVINYCWQLKNKLTKPKKGNSRSKRHSEQSDPGSSKPKRKKLNKEFRIERMKTVEDEIKQLKDHMSYKEKRRQMAEDQRNYKLCDDITRYFSFVKGVSYIGTRIKGAHQKTLDRRVTIPRRNHCLLLPPTTLHLVLSHGQSLEQKVLMRVTIQCYYLVMMMT